MLHLGGDSVVHTLEESPVLSPTQPCVSHTHASLQSVSSPLFCRLWPMTVQNRAVFQKADGSCRPADDDWRGGEIAQDVDMRLHGVCVLTKTSTL
jgi:hypothetical protein